MENVAYPHFIITNGSLNGLLYVLLSAIRFVTSHFSAEEVHGEVNGR